LLFVIPPLSCSRKARFRSMACNFIGPSSIQHFVMDSHQIKGWILRLGCISLLSTLVEVDVTSECEGWRLIAFASDRVSDNCGRLIVIYSKWL
jgi:hypothetical protein